MPGPRDRDPFEPLTPPTPTPSPPAFPDPWPPVLALHASQFPIDMERWETSEPARFNQLRSMLEQALSRVVRSWVSVELAFDMVVGLNGPTQTLSIGAWRGTTDGPGRAARKRGLRASRTPDARPLSAELLVDVAVLMAQARALIPTQLPPQVPFPNRLLSSTITPVAPASFAIAVEYELTTFLGPIDVQGSTSVGFTASNGNLSAPMAAIALSFPGIAPLIFDPLVSMGAPVGLLALAWLMVHNNGSGQPALPDLGLGARADVTGGMAPRVLLLDGFRVDVEYRPPAFVGPPSALGQLRLPFSFALGIRQPRLALRLIGGSELLLDTGTASGTVRAIATATDLDRPSYEWRVDGQLVDAGGPEPVIPLAVSGQPIGATHTFTIEVTAIDRLAPSQRASARATVTATVRRGRVIRSPRDPGL